jgi:hypothetical protein
MPPDPLQGGDKNQAAEIVFSLADDFVWASWPGSPSAVCLGRCDMVSAMMRDFLFQCEVGERLLNAAVRP